MRPGGLLTVLYLAVLCGTVPPGIAQEPEGPAEEFARRRKFRNWKLETGDWEVAYPWAKSQLLLGAISVLPNSGHRTLAPGRLWLLIPDV